MKGLDISQIDRVAGEKRRASDWGMVGWYADGWGEQHESSANGGEKREHSRESWDMWM